MTALKHSYADFREFPRDSLAESRSDYEKLADRNRDLKSDLAEMRDAVGTLKQDLREMRTTWWQLWLAMLTAAAVAAAFLAK